MYTLNLKEIKLNPPITEEKVFSGEDKEKIAFDAADYIKEQYKDVHNPITVDRMTREMVRDDKGETQRERFAREDSESRAFVKGEVEADSKLRTEVWEKYKTEIKKNSEEEWDKITSVQNDYEAKMKGMDKTGSDKLEEEMKLGIDDIKLEYSKKQDAIQDKINNESKRDWKK